jgi:diguanylate cyclase (GGDEF)-like protein/PAS domain S-box-containing protein
VSPFNGSPAAVSPTLLPTSKFAALRAWLPRGQTLPDADWLRRHRVMLMLLWAHVVALPLFALTQGVAPVLAFVSVVPIALCGLAGSLSRAGRRARSVAVVFGLLTSSAVLVSDWHGAIEAHFHFFVMIAVIAMYEDWIPFGVAVAYVVAEHGIFSAIFPHSVYAHGGNPWAWAAIHGLFVTGMAIAGIVTWRLNEDMRARMDEAVRGAHESSEGLRHAFDGGVGGMALVGLDTCFTFVNPALCEITGYDAETLVGSPFHMLTHPDEHGQDDDTYAGLVDGTLPHIRSERRYVHRDGHDIWVDRAVSAVHDDDGAIAYLLVQSYDITERRRYAAELAHRALHDPLTGLPNRSLFADRTERAIARVRRHGGMVSILFIDIDRFKLVNDGLGHDVGDEVLCEAGRRLRGAARDEDTVARLGGDEFTILCEDTDTEGCRTLAERVLDAFALPFTIGDHEFDLGVSIGIRTADAGAESADALVRDADVALYRAKELGRGRLQVFDATTTSAADDRLATERALRVALREGQLLLHYQPGVALSLGRPIAVEALVRWQHPERGLVPPGEFIPVAEESELIVEIGEWVLGEACRTLARWLAEEDVVPDLRVAVNVSARQLSRPDLPATVAAALHASGLGPERLLLEMTESALIRDPKVAHANLVALRELGVTLAIDDFGIGFSSMDQLRNLPPLDAIKVDRSFTAGLGVSRADAAVVTAVLSLARSLGMVAVVEGIESAEQAAMLIELGATMGQGFHFARPLPANEALEVLRRGVVLPLGLEHELRNAA